MPLSAWSDTYPYRSPLHDPWTGLPLEDAMSEQPITDRDPGDERPDVTAGNYVPSPHYADLSAGHQPTVTGVVYSVTVQSGSDVRHQSAYPQVAGWDDYLAACRDRDQARADLAALRSLVRAVDEWNETREGAWLDLEAGEIDQDRFDVLCGAAVDRIYLAYHVLPPELVARALEGE